MEGWDIVPVDQNTVKVINLKTEDEFYLQECDDSFRTFKRLARRDPKEADVWFDGFLKGLYYCDTILKCYGSHNFKRKE